MKTTSLLVALLLSVAFVAVAQTPAVMHNTWSSGAPMTTAVFGPAVGVLKGQIYVIGGQTGFDGTKIADTQVYNPATNTWSPGVAFPTPSGCGNAAVVKNVLYVMGGSTVDPSAVWAFNLKTQMWSRKADMLVGVGCAGVAVERNIIYIMGGATVDTEGVNTVQSYDPATDTWTYKAPLLVGKWLGAAGRIGNTIVYADGGNGPDLLGDNEGYSATTNMWTSLNPDPTARASVCGGAIGSKLYVAGGDSNNQGPGLSLIESFKLSTNTWKTTLTPMPQYALYQGSAVYKGKLYCIGGADTTGLQGGVALNNVQIYQP